MLLCVIVFHILINYWTVFNKCNIIKFLETYRVLFAHIDHLIVYVFSFGSQKSNIFWFEMVAIYLDLES